MLLISGIILVFFVIGIVQTTYASSVSETIHVGRTPWSIAYDSIKGEIYVVNLNVNSVSVINAETNKVVATIPVGKQPQSIAYNFIKGEIYVVNRDDSTVSVIDDETHKVVATIPVGRNPVGIAYDSIKGEIFVTNSGIRTILNYGETPSVNLKDNSVSVINDETHKVVATIPVGTNPYGIAYDLTHGKIFVANFGYGISPQSSIWDDNTVSVIDDETHKVVATIHLDNTLVVGGTRNNEIFGIPFGANPWGVAYDSTHGKIFVTNNYDNIILVIDAETNTVVETIKVGKQPVGIAYDSTNDIIFVTNSDANSVSVIDTKTNALIETIKVGMTPWGVAYDPTHGKIFVSNLKDNSVSVIPYGMPNNAKILADKKAADAKNQLESKSQTPLISTPNRINEKGKTVEDNVSIQLNSKQIESKSFTPRIIQGLLFSPRAQVNDVDLKIVTESGICVIGQDENCLVKDSTRKPGQIYEVVSVDGVNLKVRYSGSNAYLEKFNILPESSDGDLNNTSWNITVDKTDNQISRLYYQINYVQIP